MELVVDQMGEENLAADTVYEFRLESINSHPDASAGYVYTEGNTTGSAVENMHIAHLRLYFQRLIAKVGVEVNYKSL